MGRAKIGSHFIHPEAGSIFAANTDALASSNKLFVKLAIYCYNMRNLIFHERDENQRLSSRCINLQLLQIGAAYINVQVIYVLRNTFEFRLALTVKSEIGDKLSQRERTILQIYRNPKSSDLRRQIRLSIQYAVGTGIFLVMGIRSGNPLYAIIVYVALYFGWAFALQEQANLLVICRK